MGDLLLFPSSPRGDRGVIHVWPAHEGRDAEIGHESASGNSWGSFAHYATTEEAIVAAHALNHSQYDGVCEVYICSPTSVDGGEAA